MNIAYTHSSVTSRGVLGIMPDINWNILGQNLRNIRDNINTDDIIDELERLYDKTAISMRINPMLIEPRLYYYYCTKNTFNDAIIEELNKAYEKLLTFKTSTDPYVQSSYGLEKFRYLPDWTRFIPNILANTQLSRLLCEGTNRNQYTISYFNCKIHENLIKVFQEIFNIEVTKINDNTYEIHFSDTHILLLSEEYTKEELSKILFNFLPTGSLEYTHDIFTKQIDVNGLSENERVLKNILLQIQGSKTIRDLENTNRVLSNMTTDMENLIKHRSRLVEEIKRTTKVVDDSKNFITTLDKVNNTIKWNTTQVDGHSCIALDVTTPIFNYDEGVIRRMYSNDTICGYIAKDHWIYTLFKECFVLNKKQLMTQTEIIMDLVKNTIRRSKTYEYDLTASIRDLGDTYSKKSKYLPNPHIARFNCWGQNYEPLIELMQERKWEELIYCTIATLSNLNFNDSIVIDYLIKTLKYSPDSLKICKDVETQKILTVGDIKKEYGYEKN